MASRTQLRLSQITGSFASTNSNRIITVEPKSTLANVKVFDLSGSLSHIASAIQRIHGKGSGEAFDNTAGEFYQNLVIDTGAAASLTIGGGDDADMQLNFNQSGQDFYIGVENGVDDLIVGRGSDITAQQDFKIDGSGNATFAQNVTVTGDLTVSGETTTINTTNLNVEDSIIGLGFSGSNPSPAGDRGLLFGRATIGQAIPGLWYNGTLFNLATSITDTASSSFGTTVAYQDLNVGDIQIYDAANLRGQLKIVSSDLVLSSAAGNDLMLDSNSGKIFLQKDTEVGGFIQSDAGAGGVGLIVSASVDNALILDSNVGMIQFGKGSQDGAGPAVATIVGGDENTETLSFIKSTDQGDSEFTFKVETATNGTFANQFVAVSGSLRLFESSNGGGSNYVELKAGALGGDRSFTLPTLLAGSDDILVGNGGVLSFKSAATLGLSSASTKAIIVVTGSGFPARTSVDLGAGLVRPGSSGINDLEKSDAQGAALDVFVNGQMLLSGTTTALALATPTADYAIASTGSIQFSFDLEADDVIQVIKR